jgi:hypothetical protein
MGERQGKMNLYAPSDEFNDALVHQTHPLAALHEPFLGRGI